MNKKKRNDQGRYAERHSTGFIVTTWVAAALSVGLLYAATRALLTDFASFRSCSANSSGLTIVNCGKSSLNFGDLVFMLMFVLAAALTVSLFTAAWRFTVRGKS